MKLTVWSISLTTFLQELRESQVVEHQRLTNQMENERQRILTEKAKLETMARLQQTNETTTLSRSEIDAAVLVAQDAARQADIERDKFMQLQRSIEVKRRELINQESGIRTKENDLKMNITSTNEEKRAAEFALKSAKSLEQKMMIKLQHLQRNFKELAERETTLSQAKLEISKERLELQTMRRKLFQTRCSLCKIGEQSKEISELLTRSDKEQHMPMLSIGGEAGPLDNFAMSEFHAKILNEIDSTNDVDQIHADSMARRFNHKLFDVDLAPVPDITDIADNLLDPDLLLVKLDALNSKKYF